jgi:hypothetical protein
MRSLLIASLLVVSASGCRTDSPPTPAEITDRAWKAHALVIGAGERARTCAEAGAAMQEVFAQHRQAFVDAMALDRDKARLAEAVAFIEANEQRYADLETRMAALSDRCAEDPTVQAAFDLMSNP